MMFQRTKQRKGSLNLFFYLLVFIVIEYILLGSYAVYDVGINCPGYENIEENYNIAPNTPYNITNGSGAPIPDTSAWWDPFGVISWLGNGIDFVNMLFAGCTGIPWQVYIIAFVIPLLIVGIFIYQLVRSGG